MQKELCVEMYFQTSNFLQGKHNDLEHFGTVGRHETCLLLFYVSAYNMPFNQRARFEEMFLTSFLHNIKLEAILCCQQNLRIIKFSLSCSKSTLGGVPYHSMTKVMYHVLCGSLYLFGRQHVHGKLFYK